MNGNNRSGSVKVSTHMVGELSIQLFVDGATEAQITNAINELVNSKEMLLGRLREQYQCDFEDGVEDVYCFTEELLSS